MATVPITQDVAWVGALDPEIRIFDVITRASGGTTYNAYLVRGGRKTALIDAVRASFTDVLLANIRQVTDPADLDYVVLNHAEPDHTGAVAALAEAAPNAEIRCTQMCAKLVGGLVNRDLNITTVKDGDRVDLGGKTLQFLTAPNLHWPDTMFTYLAEDKVLFPCDFLGSHHCDQRLFDDQVGDFSYDMRYYFDHLFRPLKEWAIKGLDKIEPLDIKVIAPSHGPILRTDARRYMERVRDWSTEPRPATDAKRLLVFYASAYGNTARMAEAIAQGAQHAGASVMVFDAVHVNAAAVLDLIEAAEGMAVGSLTINADAVKPIWDLLTSFATIKVKGKVGAAFGSYGWSGEAVELVADRLRGLKFKVPLEPLRAHVAPTEDDLSACREYGAKLAAAL
jgi:flavorubredoxin